MTSKIVSPAAMRRCGFMRRRTERPDVLQRWDLAAHLIDLRQVERGDDDAGINAAFGEDLAPRVDDQRMAIGLAAILVLAALRWRDDEAARLDGARAQQDVPVRLARDAREGGGDRDDLRARDGERRNRSGKRTS